jgi:hypothetical protein
MTVVFSVIFPENLPYFDAFINSLKCQSFPNFKLVLINDGVVNLDLYLNKSNLDYQIHSVNDLTPFEIRIFGLQVVSDLNPEYIIFADSDDTLSSNRVESLVFHLKRYPFVCNDLDLVDSNGLMIEKAYWGNRLGSNYEFDIQFLNNKNIVGLGNSGMQFWPLKKMLSRIKSFKDGNDWLFFSSAEYDLNCLFISSCQTIYRQHSNNLIGRKSLELDSLINLIECKLKHYSKLKSIGFSAFDIDEQLNKINKINCSVSNNSIDIQNQLNFINSLRTNFFWWEETNYIK